MGGVIRNYYGLFCFGSHVGNVLNISNMFNNTSSNLKVKSSDFYNFSLQIYDLEDSRVVDLYNYLVDTTSGTPKIKENAY
jgi:hypothetical protein